MTTSHVSHKEQCPACAKLGKDNARDNLVVYSDGSCYCFSCGYYKTVSGIARLQVSNPSSNDALGLPPDVTDEFPDAAIEFIQSYGLDGRDIALNNILYSPFWKRIVFPYLHNNKLFGWQGRYIGTDKSKPKWFTKGKIHSHVYRIGNKKSSMCVLTEDIVSAIKVSHNTDICVCPLFGSHVPTELLLTLNKDHDKIVVWLDHDKAADSMRFSHNAKSLGINTRCVITTQDPKCYDDVTIKALLSYG